MKNVKMLRIIGVIILVIATVIALPNITELGKIRGMQKALYTMPDNSYTKETEYKTELKETEAKLTIYWIVFGVGCVAFFACMVGAQAIKNNSNEKRSSRAQVEVRLHELNDLRSKGLITEEEYTRQRNKIVSGI